MYMQDDVVRLVSMQVAYTKDLIGQGMEVDAARDTIEALTIHFLETTGKLLANTNGSEAKPKAQAQASGGTQAARSGAPVSPPRGGRSRGQGPISEKQVKLIFGRAGGAGWNPQDVVEELRAKFNVEDPAEIQKPDLDNVLAHFQTTQAPS